MKTAIIRTTGLSLLLLVSFVARGDLRRVNDGKFVSAAQLASRVVHPVDGLDFKEIATSPQSTILIARRDKTGEVEVHGVIDDILIAEIGHATVIVGGHVTGNRETAANEWRGGEQSGGTVYEVGPGDLVLIPAGSPHTVTVPADASFTYLMVKTPAQYPTTTSSGR
jgi:mannose-6-phosphate isomerase-like protein (cupin superfamily)